MRLVGDGAQSSPSVLGWLYLKLPPERRVGLGCRGAWKLALRKLLWPTAPIGVVLDVEPGLRVCVSSDPVDERILKSMMRGHSADYFPEVPIRSPASPIVLDLGAHHGFYSVFASKRYSAAEVICVEPSRQALPHLVRNLELNGLQYKAKIVIAGLGGFSGEAVLGHSPDGSWGNSLLEVAADIGEKVEVRTLEEILGGARPDIVKCNAEGAEYEFARQLRGVSARPALVSIAIHPWLGDPQSIFDHMRALGYERKVAGSAARPIAQFWLPESQCPR